ncbi:MAG: Rrf2 family transcriptional regulator [Hyphomonadaceae bacterium]
MLVGSKSRYALSAVVDVAMNGSERAVPLSDVAKRRSVSLSYLEQLFALLRRKGVVVSARGPGGGYRLSRPASEIAVLEIVEAVEDHASGQEQPGDGGAFWTRLDAHVRDFLANVTIADVIAMPQTQPGSSPDMPIPDGRLPHHTGS